MRVLHRARYGSLTRPQIPAIQERAPIPGSDAWRPQLFLGFPSSRRGFTTTMSLGGRLENDFGPAICASEDQGRDASPKEAVRVTPKDQTQRTSSTLSR